MYSTNITTYLFVFYNITIKKINIVFSCCFVLLVFNFFEFFVTTVRLTSQIAYIPVEYVEMHYVCSVIKNFKVEMGIRTIE